MAVTAIRVKLHLEQPVASAYLAILRKAGLVGTREKENLSFILLMIKDYKRYISMRRNFSNK